MVRDITLGQYMPGNSIIHRLDARSKIMLLIAYIVFIFVAGNYVSLLLMTLSSLLVVMLTRIKFMMYLKSMRVILFVVIFTGILNIFYGTGNVLWEWQFIHITDGGLSNALFVTIRIATLVMVSSILTFTTSPSDLTDALEKIMKPLTVFHVKVHEIAMMMTIALRFIPVLLEEADKIMNAQKARGADIESGGVIKRIKALIPVLIPLFVSSFRRATDLAMAMECRCYNGGNGRTRMKQLKFTVVDLVGLLFCIVIFTGVILCNIYFKSVMI
ncbi:MAG: energy-coupling factor transporter transmembrane protein EcfT [Clostridia bacterium]|nr:energy-coupling factor transporter transmembrane protein EcfT [Clostridia bacterium]